MPRAVTVIIAMYNSAATVARTIESLRAQTMTDWEAIVVNDGSTDNGPDIISALASSDPRVRMISQSNKGLASARNAGINAAQGEFLHFLDADDWLLPTGLADLLAIAQRSKTAAVGRLNLADESGAHLGVTAPYLTNSITLHEFIEACHFPVHAQLIPRAAIGAERFDETLTHVEDWDFWLRIAEAGCRWTTSDRIVGVYRLRHASMSHRSAEMLSSASDILARSYARARRTSWVAEGLDLSEERLQDSLDQLALEAATTVLLADDTQNKDAAFSLLTARSLSAPVDPLHAAARAAARLPFADCQGATAWDNPPERYLTSLAIFWERIVEEDLAPSGFVERARRRLADVLTTPELIAEHIAAHAQNKGPVVLFGLGRNARPLARALTARVIPFSGFDDASAALPQWAAEESIAIKMLTNIVQTPHNALCILTPLADESLLARVLDLPDPATLVRWRITAEHLAAVRHARLIDDWPTLLPGTRLGSPTFGAEFSPELR